MELASTDAAQVDQQADAWFASYADSSTDPSNQRRRVRHRRTRGPRRPQLHRRDTWMMIVSFVFVGAMTACFYAVLTR